MLELETKVAIRIFELGAVEFGAFRLKHHETQPDAPLSPIRLNLRTPENPKPGPLDPETVDMIGRLFYAAANPDTIGFIGEQIYAKKQKRNSHFQYVAGVPNAGDPFAKAFMKYAALDGGVYELLQLFKEERDGKRRIAGIKNENIRHAATVMFFDDLITKAASKFEAIEVAEEAGLFVRDIYVLADREQGGTEELGKAGYRVHSNFLLKPLVRFYREKKVIRAGKEAQVLEYLANDRS